MIVFDAHCDAPSQMSRLRDYRLDNPDAQVDFPKMLRGGVDASFFAAYVPASLEGEAATAHAVRLLDVLDGQMAANADIAAYARCAGGVRRNRRAGKLSILAGIENASALNGSLELLHGFYRRGVRYITLTHSADNDVADSCTGNGRWGGLSPFGRELVPAMNHIGMLIDLAHSSDATMRDVLELGSHHLFLEFQRIDFPGMAGKRSDANPLHAGMPRTGQGKHLRRGSMPLRADGTELQLHRIAQPRQHVGIAVERVLQRFQHLAAGTSQRLFLGTSLADGGHGHAD